MIKFIEVSATKLKFASYPNLKLIISFCLLVLFLIPCLIWSLWFSSISSSLTCHKTTLNFIDCQLHESSIINSHLTETSIKNLREASKPWFRKSSVIALKANPNFPYFKIIGFQKGNGQRFL